jgi:hypothetical protein
MAFADFIKIPPPLPRLISTNSGGVTYGKFTIHVKKFSPKQSGAPSPPKFFQKLEFLKNLSI